MSAVEELVVEENDAYIEHTFVGEMLKQLKALDTYDTYEGWSAAKIVDPLVLTKERKREIPVVGDPDEIVMARVKAYYNALATLIEVQTGKMAVPMINLTHEGFGRALIMVGKLIVVDKTLRDVHRFGFPSLEKMCEKSDQIISNAKKLMEQFPEVVEA